MRSAALFLLPISVLAACGGKVIFDQGTGAGGTSSASAGASGTTSSGDDCGTLIATYNAAIVSAQACNACLDVQSCTLMAKPVCGCPAPIDASNVDLVNQITALDSQIQDLGCTVPCPAMDCPTVSQTGPGPGTVVLCGSVSGDCNATCSFATNF
jgi:hypothetical protein